MKKCDGKNCGNCTDFQKHVVEQAEAYFFKEEIIREKARVVTREVEEDVRKFNMPLPTAAMIRIIETGEAGETQPPNPDKILESLTADAMQEAYENALRQGKSPELGWREMEKVRKRLEQ